MNIYKMDVIHIISLALLPNQIEAIFLNLSKIGGSYLQRAGLGPVLEEVYSLEI